MGVTKFGQKATTCVAVHDQEATETKPHKKPTKHDENMRTIERAWNKSGNEIRNEMPYISRSGLREMLIKDGASERTAKNKTESSRADGLILPMINAGTLELFEHGWRVIDNVLASGMLLQIAPKRP